MKAILSRFNSDLGIIATCGNNPENRRLTKSYRSFASLYRYGIHPVLKVWGGRLKAEIWNGESIYSEPDKIMTWNIHIFDEAEGD